MTLPPSPCPPDHRTRGEEVVHERFLKGTKCGPWLTARTVLFDAFMMAISPCSSSVGDWEAKARTCVLFVEAR